LEVCREPFALINSVLLTDQILKDALALGHPCKERTPMVGLVQSMALEFIGVLAYIILLRVACSSPRYRLPINLLFH
jgi:hypothetical protein